MSGVEEPAVYVVENFVIEAYKTIHAVPYATVNERRGGRGGKVERGWGAVGGGDGGGHVQKLCGICLIPRASGESWVTCDDCERSFHSGCLVVLARDTTSGAGNGNGGHGNRGRRCPRCVADRIKRRVVSAAAVVRLRTVLEDVHERPTLPAKLQLKLLGLSAPAIVTCALTVPTMTPTLLPKSPLPCVQHLEPCLLPLKRRPIANTVSAGAPPVQPMVTQHLPSPTLQSQLAAVKLKRVTSHKQQRSVRDLTEVLTPLAPDLAMPQEAPRYSYPLSTTTGIAGGSKHGVNSEGDAPHLQRRLATVSSPSSLRPPSYHSKKVASVPRTALRRKSNVRFSPECPLIPAAAPVAGFARKHMSGLLPPPAPDVSSGRTDVRY